MAEGGTARLGPDGRAAALAALAGTSMQVLVVGGGVVGAGVALDAATRGPVGRAWSRRGTSRSGTSSRSSKLIHGGLRYLEQLNVGLVREALTERSLLLQRIAPHLVRPVPFLFPLTHHVWERAYIGAGITAYDALGFSLGPGQGRCPGTGSSPAAARCGWPRRSSGPRSPARCVTGTPRWTTPGTC